MKPLLFTEYKTVQVNSNKNFLHTWNKKYPFLKGFALNLLSDNNCNTWHFSKKEGNTKTDLIIKNAERWEIIVSRESITDNIIIFSDTTEFYFNDLTYDEFIDKMNFMENII